MTNPNQPVRKTAFDNDPWGSIKEEKKNPAPPAREVNLFHSNSDLDTSVLSGHHSLGVKHTQAAAGDHIHDGNGSRKLGEGMGLVLTGAKGGNAALTDLIRMLKQVMTFTDNTTA